MSTVFGRLDFAEHGQSVRYAARSRQAGLLVWLSERSVNYVRQHADCRACSKLTSSNARPGCWMDVIELRFPNDTQQGRFWPFNRLDDRLTLCPILLLVSKGMLHERYTRPGSGRRTAKGCFCGLYFRVRRLRDHDRVAAVARM